MNIALGRTYHMEFPTDLYQDHFYSMYTWLIYFFSINFDVASYADDTTQYVSEKIIDDVLQGFNFFFVWPAKAQIQLANAKFFEMTPGENISNINNLNSALWRVSSSWVLYLRSKSLIRNLVNFSWKSYSWQWNVGILLYFQESRTMLTQVICLSTL